MRQIIMRDEYQNQGFPFFTKKDQYMLETKEERKFTNEELEFFDSMKLIGEKRHTESIGYSLLIKLCNYTINNAESEYFKNAVQKMKDRFVKQRKEARVVYRKERFIDTSYPNFESYEDYVRSVIVRWTFRVETRLFREDNFEYKEEIENTQKKKRL